MSKKHPVVSPANADRYDGDTHELVQANGLAAVLQLGSRNEEPAAWDVEKVVEATKDVYAEKTGALPRLSVGSIAKREKRSATDRRARSASSARRSAFFLCVWY